MSEPSILDLKADHHNWAERDPHSLCEPLRRPKPEFHCHCPVPSKGQGGGMRPVIDLEQRKVVCLVCRRPVGKGCRSAAVRHLRGLLNANPGHVDWGSIPDLLLE